MSFKRVRSLRRGPSGFLAKEKEVRCLNYSFVLHEPSFSESVQSLTANSLESDLGDPAAIGKMEVIGVDELAAKEPDLILTAHLGYPFVLSCFATRLQINAVFAVDSHDSQQEHFAFYRAPSKLGLPKWAAHRAVVAAAVLRPGGRSLDIISSETFELPDSSLQAIREIERLITAHVDQWRPPTALWSGPAELLLPEVLHRV